MERFDVVGLVVVGLVVVGFELVGLVVVRRKVGLNNVDDVHG